MRVTLSRKGSLETLIRDPTAVGRWSPDGCKTPVAVVAGAFTALPSLSWAPIDMWTCGLHETPLVFLGPALRSSVLTVQAFPQ